MKDHAEPNAARGVSVQSSSRSRGAVMKQENAGRARTVEESQYLEMEHVLEWVRSADEDEVGLRKWGWEDRLSALQRYHWYVSITLPYYYVHSNQ